MPRSAHWVMNEFSSSTVADVKLLYSLKSAPISVFMILIPLFRADFICDMAPDTLHVLK